MCLLIAQPKGVTFSKHDLKDFLSYNADGFGAAYSKNGALEIVRVVENPKLAISTYYDLLAGRPAMLHFRMATHGTTGVENCHPFLLTPEIAMAHNGILDIDASPDSGWSDTRLFAHHVLRPMALADRDALFTAEIAELLAGMIGPSNRLMFFRADGRTNIVNAKAGVMVKRAWLSNTYAWSSPEQTEYARFARYKKDAAGWDDGDFPYQYDREGDTTRRDIPSSRNIRFTPAASAKLLPAVGRLADATPIDHVGNVVEEPEYVGDLAVMTDEEAEAMQNVEMAWYGLGFKGVLSWVKEHTEEAALALVYSYDLTPEQALSQAMDGPDTATRWLVDVVSDGEKYI